VLDATTNESMPDEFLVQNLHSKENKGRGRRIWNKKYGVWCEKYNPNERKACRVVQEVEGSSTGVAAYLFHRHHRWGALWLICRLASAGRTLVGRW